MSHDTSLQHLLPPPDQTKELLGQFLHDAACDLAASSTALKKRGRPFQVSWLLLSLGCLWCLLRGWTSQLDLWRLISGFGLGPFAPVAVVDQAIYNRLQEKGSWMMQQLCAQMTQWLGTRMIPYEDRSLASFASEVLALDESTLDALKRWVPDLQGLPAGHSQLLAGRLSCLFDIRRQQWKRIDLLPNAVANCQAHAKEMVKSVRKGALLLFDLGYYNYAWFDSLTNAGIWWVSRVRSNGSWSMEHILVQRDGYFEALVFMGKYRSDRCQHLVRLVRYRYRGIWYTYICNIWDPRMLSGADIVRLYARRWDIELGFRVLKDYLQMRFMISSKPEVLGAQIWGSVLLAQLLHALHVRVAAEAGVDLFDVSLELLIRYLPTCLAHGIDIGQVIQEKGRALGFVRPSTRTRHELPHISWHEVTWPPVDLQWMQKPRYAVDADPNRRGSSSKKKKE
ncbi:IS4 family transposase [Dictyobacter formicarum]|uniref:Transposase IS4-like domain-containing protein n=2 Tax=Dictyobacter formicarum TaxID=2778368 RepID=A0ABQ3VBF8_9CHLR|nr:IS4 family transposase [Dictyobacter formicarum]GHO82546.1 hypothetical protein KSZ_05520 [Dictyobacter formicarum]GHO84975.1 hypothetical protein KSZ_29810 [Dictyobacter formicarum]GHO87349.1 hypothetical protein KSZ_53550 [Dictyobacter formicarum]